LYDKKRVYRRNGVQEYIVWQMYENKLDWFILTEGEYEPLQPDDNGVVRSFVFPGLWLDIAALLTRDMAKVITVLQSGLNLPEHAQFIELLGNRKS